MPTVLDTIKKGTEYLEKRGVDDARLSMEFLVAHVLRCERLQIYMDFDRPLQEAQLETLRDLLKRRGQREPLQHLLGTLEFLGYEYLTDSRALIPRPETEELAEFLSSDVLPKLPDAARVLDMGCGSGVLGLSLAKKAGERTEVSVTLTDICPDALALARANAEKLELDEVEFVQSDLFQNVEGLFDLTVSNLPYIPDGERSELSAEVQRDPALALYGGPEGTEIIERFLTDAREHLAAGGKIGIEHGIDQSESLRIIAEDLGYEDVVTKKDLCGITRFLFAVKP